MRLVLLVTFVGLSCFLLVGCGTTEGQGESDPRPSAQVVRGDINTALLRQLCEKLDHLIDLVENPRTVNENSNGLIGRPVKMIPMSGFIVNADNDTKLVVIDLGSKDHVWRGCVLDVTRDGRYIARVEIDTVYPNASGGTIEFLTPGESVCSGDIVSNTLK